jgi:hypothetical protein
MQEWMWQLRSAKGQQRKANAVNTNLDVSILQQLALGHCSNNGGGNVVMLAGIQRNKSGQWKARQELE